MSPNYGRETQSLSCIEPRDIREISRDSTKNELPRAKIRFLPRKRTQIEFCTSIISFWDLSVQEPNFFVSVVFYLTQEWVMHDDSGETKSLVRLWEGEGDAEGRERMWPFTEDAWSPVAVNGAFAWQAHIPRHRVRLSRRKNGEDFPAERKYLEGMDGRSG